MGRGGGGGGGHRSSGGGGGRSFGGSSSRSSRGGGSFSRSSNHSPSGSSFHRSGGVHVSIGGYRPPHHHYHYYGGGYAGGTVTSVLAAIAILFIVAVMFIALAGSNTSSSVTRSTVERTALKPYKAFSKDCLDDDAGWIKDKKTLLRGMESFYKETGVQPALAIYEEINGEKYLKASEIEEFMYGEYDELIGHERGVLLLFCEYEDSDYEAYYMAGEDAQAVMDSEACDILIDYVHSLYTGNYSDEEYFAAVFEKTGERIMAVTPTMASRAPVFIIGIVLIAVAWAGVVALKQKHKRDAEKAAETERILNSPIDRI